MRRILLKTIKGALLGILGLGLLIVSLALGFRAYRQHQNAQRLAITTPNGIEEGRYVTVGGIEQWIQIRGEDRNNPILLFVHGGPGASTLALSSGWQPWEKHFTVVQWDERGAGRTYRKTGSSIAPTMTMERMTQDGIEVAEFLRTHLHQNKVLLVGHSWGSYLGVHMVKQRPDLFSAYVGTGQIVGWPSWKRQSELHYARVVAAARAANHAEALRELTTLPVQLGEKDHAVLVKWTRFFGLVLPEEERPVVAYKIPPPLMPGFSLLDWYYFFQGARFSSRVINGPNGLLNTDLRTLGLNFAVPVFFFEGTDDTMVPIEPTEAYFKEISAPQKQFVPFEKADHFLPLNRPDEFLRELLSRVRPLTVPATATPSRPTPTH